MAELPPEPFAGLRVAARLALTLDVATSLGGLIQNLIGRLDESGCFEFAQKVPGADQTGAFIDDRSAFGDITILEQQKGFGFGIGREIPIQGLDRCLFAKTQCRAALFDPPLLVNADIRRDNPHGVWVSVDPFDDLFRPRRAMNARSFDINRVGNGNGKARAKQDIERIGENKGQ